jgi:hypothetical protein
MPDCSQCYQGPHLALVLALGVPGVLLFSVGLPVWSALYLRANLARLKEMKFASTYVLLYAE